MDAFTSSFSGLLPARIGFCGHAGVGKDEAAQVLLQRGYVRFNKGDLIKKQLDSLIWKYFGFSAFTENREEKAQIRRTLEAWGVDMRDRLLAQYIRELPEKAVSTRIMELEEARTWKALGGVLICLKREGCEGATDIDRSTVQALFDDKLVDKIIWNWGTKDILASQVLQVASKLAKKAGVVCSS